MDVIAPLLQQFIEEGAGGVSGGDIRAHDKKQSDIDKEANVTDAAITALGAVAGHLAWPQYEQLLNQFMRLMKARPAKPLIRAVCAILDNFHFALPTEDEEGQGQEQQLVVAVGAGAGEGQAGGQAMEVDGQGAEGGRKRGRDAQQGGEVVAAAEGAGEQQQGGDAQGAEGEKQEEQEEAEEEEEVQEEEEAVVAVVSVDPKAEAAAVQRALLKRILPALHDQLVEKKRGEDEMAASVRAPVALAMVKLLKLLPPAAERAELPRALQVRLASCRVTMSGDMWAPPLTVATAAAASASQRVASTRFHLLLHRRGRAQLLRVRVQCLPILPTLTHQPTACFPHFPRAWPTCCTSACLVYSTHTVHANPR